MFMRWKSAELVAMIMLQTYWKYTSFEKGQNIFYVKVHKALHGKVKRSLLFYRKLRSNLEDMGFKVNPYNTCVASKVINSTQMTMNWHVDNQKISHKDRWEITKIIKSLAKINGYIKVKRGKVHEHLGMNLDYAKPGERSV